MRREQVDAVEWVAAVLVGCLLGAGVLVLGALAWAVFA